MFKLKRLGLILLLFVAMSASAQESSIYTNDLVSYSRGIELLNKEMYGAAQKQFKKAMDDAGSEFSEVAVNAEFYHALCALELFHKDAEYLFTRFIQDHPASPKVKEAYFQLGRYAYRKKKWDQVIEWFQKVDPYDLDNALIPEFNFKYGYALMSENQAEAASGKFYLVKENGGVYAAPAQYYFGHIAYESNNYQTALESFLKLKDDPKFSPVVPYYVCQIYYMQKRFDELLTYAPAVLDSANPARAGEIAKLLGEAYYGKKQYKDAIPYLELYAKGNRSLTREDRYQLGYAYYQGGEYEKAVETFAPITIDRDKLAQTALYHLGDCYLKEGKKSYARNAFLSASEMDFDEEIAEDALLTYAKLSYELSYDPYNKSIDAFKDYIKKYPKSAKADEAYAYLLNVYLTTNNYRSAIKSLESITDMDIRLQEAYQRVCYNRAVELYQNGNYASSIQYLDKAQTYSINKQLHTLCYYWRGEAYNMLRKYDLSLEQYKKFKFGPGAILIPEFADIDYNIGYAQFYAKDYNNAIVSFRKFTSGTIKDSLKWNDANIRIGDSYFIQKNYAFAIDYYKKVNQAGLQDGDYALFQTASAEGILGKPDDKIASLNQLLKAYPNSTYNDEAYFQIGRTYRLMKGENNEAKAAFEKVVELYPNSPFVKKALVNIGAIQYDSDEPEAALTTYKTVVKNYPNYNDAKDALEGIEKCYIELGRIEEYEPYIQGLGFYNVSQTALDTATYRSAELRYFNLDKNKDYEKTADMFSRYLSKYNPPIFALNAHFYRAECLMQLGNKKAALEDYTYVLQQPVSDFTESSLSKASMINYENKDYETALAQFDQLRKMAYYASNVLMGKIGVMRTSYQLEEYQKALDAAAEVLKADKIDQSIQIEALLIRANSYKALKNDASALADYAKVTNSTNSLFAAEAQYNIAEIKFLQNKVDSAEKEVFVLINRIPTYDLWIAKGLILLADIYLQRNDDFQASATLQTVIDNSESADMVEVARKKLKAINDKKLDKAGLKEPEKIQIDFEGNESPVNEKLFKDTQEGDGGNNQ